MVHQKRNFLEQDYREDFLGNHQQEIVNEWSGPWAEEYNQMMADATLIKALEASAPEVLAWFEVRLAVVLDAQRATEQVKTVERNALRKVSDSEKSQMQPQSLCFISYATSWTGTGRLWPEPGQTRRQ